MHLHGVGSESYVFNKDNGAGIAAEGQSKIFDRYYRIENNISKTTAGFGVGLYFCSEIIKLHDGRIWVESEVGRGSNLPTNFNQS